MTSGAQTHNERLHDELLKPEAERDPAVLNQDAAAYAEQKALRRAAEPRENYMKRIAGELEE